MVAAIPQDVLLCILLEVPMNSLCDAARCCKLWHSIINLDGAQKFWKIRFELEFGRKSVQSTTMTTASPHTNWNQLFQEYYCLHWRNDQHPSTEVELTQKDTRALIRLNTRSVWANKSFTSGKHCWIVIPHILSACSWIGIIDESRGNKNMHLNTTHACSSANTQRFGGDQFDSEDLLLCSVDMDILTFRMYNITKKRKVRVWGLLRGDLNFPADYIKVAVPAVSNNTTPGSFTIKPFFINQHEKSVGNWLDCNCPPTITCLKCNSSCV